MWILLHAWSQTLPSPGSFSRGRAGVSTGVGAALVGLVLAIFIAFLLAGAILPTAFSQIFNATTTGWTTETATVFQLLPLMGTVALLIMVVGAAVVIKGR